MIEEEKYFGKTYEQILNESIKKMSSSMEEHEFRHYNNSLDMMIYSKEHYIQEMKKRRMLPYDVCEGLAEQWESKNNTGPITELSPKADRIIRSLKLTADRKGNIKLSDRAINALREIGAITGRVENFGLTNGFS